MKYFLQGVFAVLKIVAVVLACTTVAWLVLTYLDAMFPQAVIKPLA